MQNATGPLFIAVRHNLVALRPVISHLLPLAAAAEAHRTLERGHAGGKIVLDIASG